ncbi:DUF4133 domain-containing protein [Sphingobacterium sp. UGAL515B_05]|uniref:DUF4133 domain-containing protein n=1 Tax=Sphingobacterium sp. UGAL515B_05 TaxID=2986767 RepID=UPI0029535E89|nr:DUF4133 domain-containing protein [Sphingobacterium sp. UGAL515B_05]WON93766.1 DUF4133 domain-containing protein [Sphingobacterium sp. UGAL515B_05]
MANSVYKINKGINKSIEFKGLKAQYIWYVAITILTLLILFSILYFIGLSQYVCLMIVGGAGFWILKVIFSLSKKYGEHGLMKAMAKKMIPTVIKANNRNIFIKPKK